MEENAVIYLRVSTEEQAKDPQNLINQKDRCQADCQQNHLNIKEIFTDEGESARTDKRPAYQRMLAFCNEPKNDVRCVVVQDLSRFARNNQVQAEAIYKLSLSGIRLRSTFEPNIDNTAAGKLIANIFGSFNQYFSDSHSEKQRVRKRDAVKAGRVPWRANLGFINVKKAGANIEQDPVRAPLILEGFRLIAEENQGKAGALKIITDKGLKTLKGQPVSSQSWDKMLRNPIYAGWVVMPSAPDMEPVRGQHKAIVTQEMFDRVHWILSGKESKKQVKQKAFNPEFPLRHMTHCAECDRPLTGAFLHRKI